MAQQQLHAILSSWTWPGSSCPLVFLYRGFFMVFIKEWFVLGGRISHLKFKTWSFFSLLGDSEKQLLNKTALVRQQEDSGDIPSGFSNGCLYVCVSSHFTSCARAFQVTFHVEKQRAVLRWGTLEWEGANVTSAYVSSMASWRVQPGWVWGLRGFWYLSSFCRLRPLWAVGCSVLCIDAVRL